jgi:hypothetical protein
MPITPPEDLDDTTIDIGKAPTTQMIPTLKIVMHDDSLSTHQTTTLPLSLYNPCTCPLSLPPKETGQVTWPAKL